MKKTKKNVLQKEQKLQKILELEKKLEEIQDIDVLLERSKFVIMRRKKCPYMRPLAAQIIYTCPCDRKPVDRDRKSVV